MAKFGSKIGFLGGSFDPVHNGHLKLAAAARRQLSLDKVYFVLARQSPFKWDQKPAPASLRLKLLKAALRAQSRFAAAPWELKRPGPSYTVTTLRQYHRRHPGHRLFLIMGSDAFSGLGGWKDSERIKGMATIVVGRRPGAAIAFVSAAVNGELEPAPSRATLPGWVE